MPIVADTLKRYDRIHGRLARLATVSPLGSGLGLIVLLLLIVSLAMAFFLEREVERKAQKGLPVVATITKLRFGFSRYRLDLMAGVEAQDGEGAIGTESVEAILVAGCEVGDKIRARRAGAELILEPMPCR